MKMRSAHRGFSLVELLAVVLILAVLAAVAVPIYLNTRKTSAARACKANLNAIASAESAKALREGEYLNMAELQLSAPEGLTPGTKCPLDGDAYLITETTGGAAVANGGTTEGITIRCPNDTDHDDVVGVTADYSRTMPAIVAETIP